MSDIPMEAAPAADKQSAAPVRRMPDSLASWLLVSPLAVVLAIFLVVPIVVIVTVSFWGYNEWNFYPDFTFENYEYLLTSSVTWATYLNTLKYVVLSWLFTASIGFAAAYFLAFHVRSTVWQIALFLICTVPFWTSSADSADLRWWAVRALAECGTIDAILPLVAALRDKDPGVRAVAARVLSHLHVRFPMAVRPQLVPIALLLTDADGLVRQSAADALALCGDDAVPVLAAILDGTALNIATPTTAERDSTEILLNDEGARSRAAQSLHKIATIQAAPVLYRHLEDPNHLVRTHAYEALDKMGLLENTLITLS